MPSFARIGCRIGLLLFVSCGRVTAQTEPVCPDIQPVQCIQFTGNTVLSTEQLMRIAGIRTETPLPNAELSAAVNRIQEGYSERGYVADFVYYEILGEQPPRTLVFHIRELKIGRILINGLTKTEDVTVRQFIRIQPGFVYSRRAVGDAVARLSSLGIFDTVEVYLREGAEPGLGDLVFEVKEAKTRRVDLGGSYAPQGELILKVGYTESNFRGRAEQLTANLDIGSLQARVSGGIGWYTPMVGGNTDRTFGFRAFSDVLFRFSNDLINTPNSGRYYERRSGVNAVMTDYQTLGRTLIYGFRYHNTSVTNYPFDFISQDVPSPDGWIGVANVTYVQDRRVRLVFPVAGTYFSGYLEPGYSGPTSGQSGGIARVMADARWLIPLQPITAEALAESDPKSVRTFATRLSAGTSVGPLPFYEQFFLGGVDSMRGYRESRFWGRYFFLLNTEIRWPVSRNFVGLLLADLGDAWGSEYQIVPGVSTDYGQHVKFAPRGSYGVGLWYALPQVGLVRLVYAKGEDWWFSFAVGESY